MYKFCAKPGISPNNVCSALHFPFNSIIVQPSNIVTVVKISRNSWYLISIGRFTRHIVASSLFVRQPESEVPPIQNSNFCPPSQTPSGCMTNPLCGIQRMCCITHSMPFTQFVYTLVMKHMSSQMLFVISRHDHFTKHNNFPCHCGTSFAEPHTI